MKTVFAVVLFMMSGIEPAGASDPLTSWRSLVGSWNCTYHAGRVQVTYAATYAYDMNGNWIRERDSWAGGGGDQGMFTYEPKRGWTAVVMEQERTTTIFRAPGGNPDHVVYRSVYPDASMSEIFDRASPTQYTLHFTQTTGGKTTRSTDTCVKT